MSRFFNQKTILVEEYLNFLNIVINIETPYEGFQLEYYEGIDEVFEENLVFLHIDTPVLITIVGEFKKFKKQKIEDFEYFILAIKSVLFSHIINKDVDLSREKRLGIPKHLKGIHLSDLTLMGLINKEVRFPIVNVEIKDVKGKIINKVF